MAVSEVKEEAQEVVDEQLVAAAVEEAAMEAVEEEEEEDAASEANDANKPQPQPTAAELNDQNEDKQMTMAVVETTGEQKGTYVVNGHISKTASVKTDFMIHNILGFVWFLSTRFRNLKGQL